MPAAWILVLRSRAHQCTHCSFEQLFPFVSSSLPAFQINVTSAIGELGHEEPALVVIQSCRTAELLDTTEQLRLRGMNAPRFAVMCGMGANEDLPLAMTRELDDYICCPFPRPEFLLRP